jgi:hypothetical protein
VVFCRACALSFLGNTCSLAVLHRDKKTCGNVTEQTRPQPCADGYASCICVGSVRVGAVCMQPTVCHSTLVLHVRLRTCITLRSVLRSLYVYVYRS